MLDCGYTYYNGRDIKKKETRNEASYKDLYFLRMFADNV